ncbi:MAG: glutamine amidotransferase [Pirellulaceae bacterium]
MLDTNSTFGFLPPLSLGLVGTLATLLLAAIFVLRWLLGPAAPPARRWGLVLLRSLTLVILLAILLNPIRVDESPGPVERSRVVYLLDSSQSMSLGDVRTRWEHALAMIGQCGQLIPPNQRPELSVYRFGEGISAIDLPDAFEARNPVAAGDEPEPGAESRSLGPTDMDTQLVGALQELTGRFGRVAPRAVVLFSDGQAKDPPALEETCRRYAVMGVPIHAVPVGTADRQGDVAIVGMVVPTRVRKQSQQTAQVSVRSYGYDGRRTEVVLSALGEDGRPERQLNRLPITLTTGLQSLHLTFQTGEKPLRIQVSIPPQPDEVSTDNNSHPGEIEIDRTKIRVLYVTRNSWTGSALSAALTADPDLECITAVPLSGSRQVGGGQIGTFPDTVAQLFAYDVIVLEDVPQSALQTFELEWLEQWVGRRGGGLCMVGGPNSFASGGWRGSALEEMAPVALEADDQDWDAGAEVSLLPVASQVGHPLWAMVSDPLRNREILTSLPAFSGATRLGPAKPAATAIGIAKSDVAENPSGPALVVGPYGKGRTMALAMKIPSRWAVTWGQSDNRYFAKFWRNAIYWLSETSSCGRRRLIATSDKILYRPGETVLLQAAAYDEMANLSKDCRVTVTVEPRSSSAQITSDYSPLRWPRELQRIGSDQGPFIAWTEEIELPRHPDRGGGFELQLPIAESSSVVSASPAVRLEVSAYENATLIDSSSIDIQMLDDPPELQNPLPNPQLMSRIASLSGGKVLSDAASLAATLRELPNREGSPRVEKVPVWSTWWLLVTILGLLTLEWVCRRRLGMA